jgi:opacity protein-like surface antigen
MNLKLSRFASTALLAATIIATPLAAKADDHGDHGNHGGWQGGGGEHYDHHNYGGDRGDYRGGDGDRGGIGVGGVLLGLGLGALVGGAIVQSQQPQYYAPPPPVYYAPPPPAYYAPPPGAYYQPY